MKILKQILVHLLVISFFILPVVAFGQDAPGVGNTSNESPGVGNTTIGVKINNPFNCGTTAADDCNIMTLIKAILNNIIMPIAAVGVVIWIIWAGFTFIQAQGNPKAIEEAKQRLLWSLIGAGILLGAAGISAVVENTVKSVINP